MFYKKGLGLRVNTTSNIGDSLIALLLEENCRHWDSGMDSLSWREVFLGVSKTAHTVGYWVDPGERPCPLLTPLFGRKQELPDHFGEMSFVIRESA